ncbi:MAG: restriction endonuclease subunit S [Pseudomonadota bacterium]
MSELPKGWSETTLGALSEYITSGSRDWSKYYSETGALFVRTQDINTNKINHISSIAKVLLPEKVEGKRTLIQKGDILITITGANVGKCAHIAEELPEAYVSQSVALVRLIDSNLAKFIQLQLITPTETDFKTALEASAYGMGRPVLNLDNVRDVTVKLAPLTEQTRIAAKLDELLTQVDTLKARIDAIPALLKRFRQSVLAAAVSGRLTEEWRGEVNDWQETTIGEICSVATGKTPKRDTQDYWAGGDIPWLTSAATGADLCLEAEQFVTNFAVKDCGLKIFQPGTLLLAMYGEGKTRGQVTELRIAAACNQACAAITVNEGRALKSFVKIRLQENYEEIRKQAVGGAQPNLNLNKVREISIRLPSLAEQTEIIRRVEQLFAFADQLETKVASAKSRIDHLTQSILAKAFRGELVPQDPSDEPASVLLERIKTQRAAAPKAKQARKDA